MKKKSFLGFVRASVFAACLMAGGLIGVAVQAQEGGGDSLVFVRDAEIEDYLQKLAAPIYQAADIAPGRVNIFLVRNSTLNAFVAEGMNEFFYTGLLQATDTPEQLAGVIAHETGHIAGGHLIRGKEELRNASAEALLTTLLAVAAGAAAGSAEVAAGGAMVGSHLAERGFLRFSRAQESSADAAALSYLDRAGISSRGMAEFLGKLSGQELLPPDRQVEYVRTHPLTQDRIDVVRRHAEASPIRDRKLDKVFYTAHERMKAKLLGFLRPETALLRYGDADPRIAARYARAIALYRTGKLDRALILVGKLIREEPNNPFFYELNAQILFENGKIDESLPLYQKANQLFPRCAVLLQAYGHALLESKGKDGAKLDQAIKVLLESNRLEGQVPLTWRFLAMAWGKKAEKTKQTVYAAQASYALAEEALARGNEETARHLAERAIKGLPKGSAYWLRAQDIKLATEKNAPAEPRRRPVNQ